MSPDKAKTLPLKKFYIDLKWTRLVKTLENYGVSMSSIYDILNVLDSVEEPRAFNILIEGTILILFIDSTKYSNSILILE